MPALADWPLLVEPAQLLPQLAEPSLIIVDLSSALAYADGHIPGARWVDPRRTLLGTAPAAGLLPPLNQLEALFGELGHREDAHYLVYDDEGGGWAGRFVWILDVIGHQRVHYLNGGLHAWKQEGLPLSTEVPQAHSGRVALSLSETPSASCEYLKSRLGAEDLCVWDARSAAEYRGERVLAARGGHIPGAKHFEWTAGMDAQRALRIRADIRERLAAAGISADKEVITHCQSHHRSGFTYLLARVLGFARIKAYPGSWGEWGNRTDTPIEN